ncbi:hypothetical protein G039_0331670 [Pseudomonas aeruginosa VRFPA01]|nr:hypothetical protein G039_0331670 [Pseudomonas aeruginosa VRFPA01]
MVAWHVADDVSRHGASMAGPRARGSNQSAPGRFPLSAPPGACHRHLAPRRCSGVSARGRPGRLQVVSPQAGRRTEDPRAGKAAADGVEQRRGRAPFVDPAGDGADLQVGVDFGMDVHQVALVAQVVDEMTEVESTAVHRFATH